MISFLHFIIIVIFVTIFVILRDIIPDDIHSIFWIYVHLCVFLVLANLTLITDYSSSLEKIVFSNILFWSCIMIYNVVSLVTHVTHLTKKNINDYLGFFLIMSIVQLFLLGYPYVFVLDLFQLVDISIIHSTKCTLPTGIMSFFN